MSFFRLYFRWHQAMSSKSLAPFFDPPPRYNFQYPICIRPRVSYIYQSAAHMCSCICKSPGCISKRCEQKYEDYIYNDCHVRTRLWIATQLLTAFYSPWLYTAAASNQVVFILHIRRWSLALSPISSCVFMGRSDGSTDQAYMFASCKVAAQ